MHVRSLELVNFRNHTALATQFETGVTVVTGPNGRGKTNLVESVAYLATLSSHRTASTAPLIRMGAQAAVVRATVQRDDRELQLECQLRVGSAVVARVNGGRLPRARELLGLLRVVVFAPSDLALVRGEPHERRVLLDELLLATAPRYAGVRSDYERVLRQRNALLKTTAVHTPAGHRSLGVWDEHLARLGAELTRGRDRLVAALRPHVVRAYAELAPAAGSLTLDYAAAVERDVLDRADTALVEEEFLRELVRRREDELRRGVSLVGPHRDDLALALNGASTRLYASHGEGWSVAVALRLGAYELAREQGVEPVLVLDDVFAELDTGRRAALAARVADAEQVLVTAAVDADVPAALAGPRRYLGADSQLTP